METKECPMCKNVLNRTEFYSNKVREGGINTYCKKCEAIYKRLNRDKNKKTYKKLSDKYYQKNKEEIKKRHRKWYDNNKLKVRAHDLVNYYLRKGRLIKNEVCELCGGVSRVAHHNDYNKPLEVMWLCDKCHNGLHFTKHTIG